MHSYPKVYNLGHPAISELFSDPVVVQEKVDGSQFSFGIIDGELKCRSKGAEIFLDNPEKMFEKAVEAIKELSLMDGWTYRGEFLRGPSHNTLKYNRTPRHNIILFDT